MSTLPVGINGTIPVAVLSEAFGAAFGGPWSYGGALYIAVTDHLYELFTAIYQSTDGGQTWAALDAAHQPGVSGIAQFDGSHTVVTAYPSAGAGVQGPIYLQNFDLSTGTWGAAYAISGAPSGAVVDFVGFRPSGSTVILYQIFTDNKYFFAEYASGTWSGALAIDVNYAGAISVISNLATAAIDAAGNVHAFMPLSASGSDLPWNVFYQEITPANALGGSHTFPDSNNGSLISLGVPVMLGSQVFLPAFVSDAGAVGFFLGIGTSWGAVVGPIDPGLSSDPTLLVQISSTPGFATVSNGALIFVYTAQGSDTAWSEARLRVLQTTSLSNPSTGWTGATIADVETFPASLLTTPAKSQRILGLGPYQPGIGIAFNMFQPLHSPPYKDMGFFLGVQPSYPLKLTLRGVNRRACDPGDAPSVTRVATASTVKRAV